MGAKRWFSVIFWVCCALLAVPLWTVEYLPMADLPQRAAQISIWTRWSDPEFGYQRIYTQDWFTPYLFGSLLRIQHSTRARPRARRDMHVHDDSAVLVPRAGGPRPVPDHRADPGKRSRVVRAHPAQQPIREDTRVLAHSLLVSGEKGRRDRVFVRPNFPLPFRHRPEAEPGIPPLFVWNPRLLSWKEHGGDTYDYFVVRDFGKDPSPFLTSLGAPVTFLGRSGPWQLFKAA